MIPRSDEPKCKKMLDEWERDEVASALEEIESKVSEAPDMTPIEEIVFFLLMKEESAQGWEVKAQKKIGKYRVDFTVKGLYFVKPFRLSEVVIECDGHDFHERTKEQAQKDKGRDRWLQSEGYQVYRFTGSEIWRSEGRCVLEALGVKEDVTN